MWEAFLYAYIHVLKGSLVKIILEDLVLFEKNGFVNVLFVYTERKVKVQVLNNFTNILNLDVFTL